MHIKGMFCHSDILLEPNARFKIYFAVQSQTTIIKSFLDIPGPRLTSGSHIFNAILHAAGIGKLQYLQRR